MSGAATGGRTRLLAALQRRPNASVQELVEALGLAPMTVRHHLTRLLADGLVETQPRAAVAGRPALGYQLTPAGDALFPKQYGQIARALLTELQEQEHQISEGPGPGGPQPAVPERVAKRAADSHRPMLEQLQGRERVEAAAGILREESGAMELRWDGSAFELSECNCVYQVLLDANDDTVCRFHAAYVSELVGAPVAIVTCKRTGDDCCEFRLMTHRR